MTLLLSLVQGTNKVELPLGAVGGVDGGYNQTVAPVQARTLAAASLTETSAVHQRIRDPVSDGIDLYERYASASALRDATHELELMLEAANRGGDVRLEYSDGSGGVDDAWQSGILAASLQWPSDQLLRLRNKELAVTINLTRDAYWMGERRALVTAASRAHGAVVTIDNASGVTEAPLEVQIVWPSTAELRVVLAGGVVATAGSLQSASISTITLPGRTETVWRKVSVPAAVSGWRRVILASGVSGSALTTLREEDMWLSVGIGSSAAEWRRAEWRRFGYLDGRESSFVDLGTFYMDGDTVWLRAWAASTLATGSARLYFAPAEQWRSYVGMGTPTGTLVDDAGEVSGAGGVVVSGDVLTAIPGERTAYLALVETASGVRTATPSVGVFYRPRRLTI